MSKATIVPAALTIGLTLLLIGYASLAEPTRVSAEVGISTVIAAGLTYGIRRLRDARRAGMAARVGMLELSSTCFYLTFSAVTTVYAVEASAAYGEMQFLDKVPAYTLVVRLVHYACCAALVWGAAGDATRPGLALASTYTSILYVPTFDVPEFGPPFVALSALALVLVVEKGLIRNRGAIRHVALPLGALLALGTWAALRSESLGDSLTFVRKLLVLVTFMLVLSGIDRAEDWKRLLGCVALVSVGLPAALGVSAWARVAWRLGLWPAARYRLYLTELGGANLVARSLLAGLPAVWAFARVSPRKKLWRFLGVGALVVLAGCRSWGAWGGAAVTAIVLLAITKREDLNDLARRNRAATYAAAILAPVLAGVALWGATRANITSFNGRLAHFRIALNEIAAHPVFGVGPGHSTANARYAENVTWLVDNRFSRDNPLWAVELRTHFPKFHSHNLFLEWAAGMGLPALAAFTWFLVRLLRNGIGLWSSLTGGDRRLVLACMAGIVFSLAWGLLDVMWVSPPFFTQPTWALAGLLLSAPYALGGQQAAGLSAPRPAPSARQALCAGLIVAGVVAPGLGNLHYRAAYGAYQAREWRAAADRFALAGRWWPPEAHYPQLRASALINLGEYREAIASYERAARLKRSYAPYLDRLGWLYWLQGDLDRAISLFRSAVQADPLDLWQADLHVDLALALLAGGAGDAGSRTRDPDRAAGLLGDALRLYPTSAASPHWLSIEQPAGTFDVVLDPGYYVDAEPGRPAGEPPARGSSAFSEARILAKVGQADYTARSFGCQVGTGGALSIRPVLDALESDYLSAGAEPSAAAARLSATLAEASRLAGLEERAERAYLAFQKAYPGSSHGFRELGVLYRDQGRSDGALQMLARAVQVSPRDAGSWTALAQVALEQGMPAEAEHALDQVYRLAPLDPRLYTLRAQLYAKRGDWATAAEWARRLLYIENSYSARLALADLERQSGRQERAGEMCRQAARMLLEARPRLLDPRLWEVGACLASAPDDLPAELADPARGRPAAGDVLLGHFYRARGEWDPALQAYQRAAEAQPREGAAHYFLGETWRALGEAEDAERAYRRAAELDPRESLPLLALGTMLWEQGRQDAAAASLRAAVERTPGWDEAQIALGNVELALGQPEEAERHYRLAQMAAGDVGEGQVYDFLVHLPGASIDSPGPQHVRQVVAAIGGDRRRALFQHPNSRVSYRIKVDRGVELVSAIATQPESWPQPGDGVTFSLQIHSEEQEHQVFEQYLDPKRNADHRRWHPVVVSLGAYEGQEVIVSFQTDSGLSGDDRYDWALWGQPRLVAARASAGGDDAERRVTGPVTGWTPSELLER